MKIVIIGGVVAGTKAAAKTRRLKPDYEIKIFTEDTHVSYSECGFPYFIEGEFNDEADLYARTVEEFEHDRINIYLEHKCTKILPDEKKVLIKNYDNEFVESYDKLLIATGAKPFVPPIKNNKLKNIFYLRRVEDALAIKEIANKSQHATIVGGGYIGIELLEAFTHLGLKTSMIDPNPFIMSNFDQDISELIQRQIIEDRWNKVEIITPDSVSKFIGDDTISGVKTLAGANFDTDFAVICTGVKPNVELAKDAGIEIGTTGAIKVNEKMETNIKDIYAAGDCIEKIHMVSHTPVWIPLGSTATKEGRCAGMNMCGVEEKFEGVLGSVITKFFNYSIGMTGLTEKQSSALGYSPISATITKSDKVSYMKNAESITVKLTADKNTRQLLGTQIVGKGDVINRINAVTSTLICNAPVDELIANDLPYAPPFSTSIDPLLTAGEQLIKKLNNIK